MAIRTNNLTGRKTLVPSARDVYVLTYADGTEERVIGYRRASKAFREAPAENRVIATRIEDSNEIGGN